MAKDVKITVTNFLKKINLMQTRNAMKNLKPLTIATLLIVNASSFAASFSDNVYKEVTFEVKKAPVPITIAIIPMELIENDYPKGTKIADIKITTDNGSSQRLALRFSPTNSNQVTETSGSKTILKGKGKNFSHELPLQLVGDAVSYSSINGIDMIITETTTPSYTFSAMLAGEHKINAGTYTLSVEGAIYNP
ncbi:hypothetical protein ELK40_00640 (plasmid) [Enterobacter sp. N18-03635]|uniref:hypothetical protein n=1 Tax=Enterobacter sp. N18-03635 TaxID=2500132 RepID=UPI000FDBD564|nr:hypothetical protein [Enterobacter sp. N18-03635]AZV03708.1 hypothetical protein ELK40_00640 [Enterobacter sp. N18-03635]